MDIEVTIDFEKSSERGDYVRGYAYLMTGADGLPVTDYSGQFIEDAEVLREAAHQFMDTRISKADHGKIGPRLGIGEVVESLVIDDDIAKALNIQDRRRGWFVGVKVHDADIQKSIRNKELVQFSINGRGRVQDMDKAA